MKARRTDCTIKAFSSITAPVALIMIQPDFGAVFILIVGAFILFFIAQYPIKFYVLCIVLGVAGLVGINYSAPYRFEAN